MTRIGIGRGVELGAALLDDSVPEIRLNRSFELAISTTDAGGLNDDTDGASGRSSCLS